MGLYNLLFGQNPNSGILLALLDIDQNDGNWKSGRFRDIYVDNHEGKQVIALYTRNGGGNRSECWDEDEEEKDYWNDEKKRCDCPACCINKNLPKHPNYLFDKDDDFDSTYNTCYFSVPEGYELAKDIFKNPKEKWDELFKDLEANNMDNPAVQKGIEAFKPMFEKIKEWIESENGKKETSN